MTEQIPAWVGDELTPVDKLEVHRKGLRHKAVSIFVMDGEKVLIQRRAAGKYHSAGLWSNTCCTHPQWGERPEECAVRRLREELGITGLYPAHADRLEYRANVGGGLIEHEVVEIGAARHGGRLWQACCHAVAYFLDGERAAKQGVLGEGQRFDGTHANRIDLHPAG